MGHTIDKLPPWARKTLKVLTVLTMIGGSVTGILSMYFDIRSKAKAASERTEVGYQTLAPAIEELQKIAAEDAKWSDDVSAELEILRRRNESLKDRIVRLETYIEVLSSVRNVPPLPPEPEKDPTVVVDDSLATLGVKKKPVPPPRKEHYLAVPKSIGKAEVQQMRRAK